MSQHTMNETPNPSNLKPDLGLHRREQGFRDDVAQFFYGVEFVDIDFISPGLHSVMVEFREGDTLYAVSFDFDNRVAKDIFTLLSPKHQTQFLASIHGRNFPFRATLPTPIALPTVESYLGELQRGAHDSFIPFVIKRVQ